MSNSNRQSLDQENVDYRQAMFLLLSAISADLARPSFPDKKPNLRVLQRIITAVNSAYPFPKEARANALNDLCIAIKAICKDDLDGKFDRKRSCEPSTESKRDTAQVVETLLASIIDSTPPNENLSRALFTAITEGKIKHVTVNL